MIEPGAKNDWEWCGGKSNTRTRILRRFHHVGFLEDYVANFSSSFKPRFSPGTSVLEKYAPLCEQHPGRGATEKLWAKFILRDCSHVGVRHVWVVTCNMALQILQKHM